KLQPQAATRSAEHARCGDGCRAALPTRHGSDKASVAPGETDSSRFDSCKCARRSGHAGCARLSLLQGTLFKQTMKSASSILLKLMVTAVLLVLIGRTIDIAAIGERFAGQGPLWL